MTYIYGLSDPRCHEIRYIGKANNPEDRLRAHLRRSKGAKLTWILELLAQQLRPEIVILEKTSAEHWQDAERKWIAKFRLSGADLFNIANGGNGPSACSDETKKKLSLMKQASTKNAAHLKRLNIANRGRVCSEATRRKIGDNSRGREATPETRAKLSAAHRGHKHSAETKAKLSEIKKNSPRNAEIMEQLRQLNIGRKRTVSAATRKKLSDSSKGRKHSAETRRRMSKAQLKRRARETSNQT